MTTQEKPATIGKEIEWAAMLETALTVPGSMGSIYNRFVEYSFGNQMLLFMQGVREPVNTYKRWSAMGRQVLKGSKAKAILRPVVINALNEQGEKEPTVKGFKLVNCLFGASETEGADLPPAQPRIWDKQKALGALAITEVPFEMHNGNVQGYGWDRKLAVSPVAAFPVKTLMHEMSHIVAGHTVPSNSAEYQTHRGLFEFEAEASAYLVMNELSLTEEADMSESRGYLQSWMRGSMPPDENIKRVFKVTDTILKAGFVLDQVEGES